MKRLFIILLLVLMSAWPAESATKDDNATKPLVFVVSNNRDPVLHAINDGSSKLAETLRNNGFRINQGVLPSLADGALDDIDILYLPIPKFSILEEDKIALRQFLRNGGGLLIMTYPKYSDLSNIDSVINDYGMSFGQTTSGPSKQTVPSTSPMSGSLKCENIGRSAGVYYTKINLTAGNAEKTAYSTAGVLAAYSTSKSLGKGRMVVISNDTLFSNNNLNYADNKNFAINMMKYLAGEGGGSYDYNLAVCKYKGNNLTGGDNLTLIAAVKNIGQSESVETKVRFYISDDGTLSAPPSTMATLKTVNLPVIDAGKRKKVKVTAKLPAWLAPGTYYLHAVVDPDGKTDDPNTENNEKLGKKELIVN